MHKRRRADGHAEFRLRVQRRLDWRAMRYGSTVPIGSMSEFWGVRRQRRLHELHVRLQPDGLHWREL